MNPFLQFPLWSNLSGWRPQVRAARQSALLSVLAIATEKKLPLVPLLDAFADDSQAGWRRDIRDLSGMLEGGSSLPDALESVPRLLPASTLLAVRVGAESGNLGPALKLAAKRLSPADTTDSAATGTTILYLCSLAVILSTLLTFIMVFIIPKFHKIFDDFGVELPQSTQFVLGAAEFALTYGLLLIPLILGVMAVAVLYVIAAGRPAVPLTGLFKPLARLVPRLATGDILRNLSIAVSAGRPLLGALSTMAGFHPVPDIRKRMARVADDVEQGRDCWQMLRQAGIIRQREAALFASAERTGNLAWTLERTADAIDGRTSFRLGALAELIRPLLIVLFGAVVGTVVVGLFMPLVKLLHDYS